MIILTIIQLSKTPSDSLQYPGNHVRRDKGTVATLIMSGDSVPQPISLVRVHRVFAQSSTRKVRQAPLPDPFAYMRETQRYIRTLQTPFTPPKPRLRQILFPDRSMPLLPPVKREKPLALSNTSLRGSKDYAVTSYMLTMPVRTAGTSTILPRQHRQSRVNPYIDSFLNRFDRKTERGNLPGILLNPT